MSKKTSVKDKMRDKMADKWQENKNRKNFIGYLNTDGLEIEFFKPKKDKYAIDIIPFIVETDNHPTSKKGEHDYSVEIWVHYGLGIDEKSSFLCLEKIYNQKCPICEYIRANELEKDEYDKLRPKQRVIYNILDHKDDEVKLFDVSHHLFEREWQIALEDHDEDEEIITPIYDDGGSSIRFTDTGVKGLGRFTGFRFKKISDFDPRILKKAISLEKLLVIPTYDEVRKEFECEGFTEKNEEDYYEEVVKNSDKEEDEEPAERKSKKSNKCPEGFTFGNDFDEDDLCDECDREIWRECKKLSKTLEEDDED